MTDSPPRIDLSVVIPTFNRSRLLCRCLHSLDAQDYAGRYEVIVVDDGSRDDTAGAVADLRGRVSCPVRYLFQPNRGPAAARNRGIAEARGEIIAFIDDDHIASPSWLSEISRVPSEGPVVGLCGRNRSLPARTNAGRYCAFLGLHERPHLDADGSVEHLMTGNAALRSEVVRELGGFDGRFRAAFRGIAPGGEDTALSRSLKERGLKLRYNPGAITDHRQKEGLASLLKESFNFGCNRVLWGYLEGRVASAPAAWWRFLRAALSAIALPQGACRFRRNGPGWADSLAFSLIEKASYVCFESGMLAGRFRLNRRLRMASHG